MKNIVLLLFSVFYILHSAFSQGIWTSKGTIGGVSREYPAAFTIGNYGYICAGGQPGNYLKDLWQYDPSSNVWTQKASLPGAGRDGAVGFSIGVFGYVGTGSSGSAFLNDFWRYNSVKNIWSQRANFPGTPR